MPVWCGGIFRFPGDGAKGFGVLSRVDFCSAGDELSARQSCPSLKVRALLVRELPVLLGIGRARSLLLRLEGLLSLGRGWVGNPGALPLRESMILLKSKDTLLMHRIPVTITVDTQSNRCLIIISQAGEALPSSRPDWLFFMLS